MSIGRCADRTSGVCVKELQDMSLEELWQLFPIILKEHDPAYKTWYTEEKARLLNILGCHAVFRISHIGSTAVEGLIAKPTVDILVELPETYGIRKVAALLEADGWAVMATNEGKKTLDLNKGYTPAGFAQRVYHLHVKQAGDWGELYFRDYLRAHADVAAEYERLKLDLQKRFEHDRDAYTDAKTEFIAEYTQKAREEFAGRYSVV